VLALDGAPIRKARITAESDRPCSESGGEATEADANGRFELRLPCAGVWRLSGEATGFPKQRYEQHDGFSTGIVLNAAHPAHEVVFRMAPSSSILGTVLDEAGEPVRDAKVFLLMAEPAGEEPFRTVDQTITDDRGLYEFSGLSPAGYFVAVQAQPWYAVAAGSTRGIGNLQVNAGSNAAMDPSLDVTYPITYFPAATDAASASTVEVAAGATQQADIHLSPVPSVHVVLPAGGRASLGFGGGRPMGRGGPTPPIEELTAFGALRFEPTSVHPLADGSVEVGGFAPGEYALAEARRREGAGEQEFTIGEDAARTVSLAASAHKPEVARETTGTLTGTVLLAGEPCEGALVLLVPVVGANAALRRQQSNTDGSFGFEKVPIGKYIAVAVDQGWSLDLKDRQTLDAFLVHGSPVDFKGSTTLRTPLAAQSR
jgi:hypothetical protein